MMNPKTVLNHKLITALIQFQRCSSTGFALFNYYLTSEINSGTDLIEVLFYEACVWFGSLLGYEH